MSEFESSAKTMSYMHSTVPLPTRSVTVRHGKIAAELIGPQLKPAGLIGPQFDMAKMATALISPYLDPLTGLIELEQLLS